MGVPGAPMPVDYYKLSSNSKPYSYRGLDGYKPDAIFFALGPNDYSNLIKPSDSYFVQSYQQMILDAAAFQLRYLQNAPKIICTCYADEARICSNVGEAVRAASFAYARVHLVEVPRGIFSKETQGCIGHLNVEGHRRVAEAIYPRVRHIMEED